METDTPVYNPNVVLDMPPIGADMGEFMREKKGKRTSYGLTAEGKRMADENWGLLCSDPAAANFDEVREKIRQLKELANSESLDDNHKRFNNLMFRSLEQRVRHYEELRVANSLTWQDIQDIASQRYAKEKGLPEKFAQSIIAKRILKVDREISRYVESNSNGLNPGQAGLAKEYIRATSAALIRNALHDTDDKGVHKFQSDDIDNAFNQGIRMRYWGGITHEQYFEISLRKANECWVERSNVGVKDLPALPSPTRKQSRIANRLARLGAAAAGAAAGFMLWAGLQGAGNAEQKPVEDKSAPTGTLAYIVEAPTSTPEFTITPSPTFTPPPTETPTQTATDTLTEIPTKESTATMTVPPTETATETPTEEPTATQEFTPTEPPARFESHVPSPELQGLADVIINNSDNPYYGAAYEGAIVHSRDNFPAPIRDAFTFPYTRGAIDAAARIYGIDVEELQNSLTIYTSPQMDSYLDDGRNGSTATTPITVDTNGNVHVNAIAFDSDALEKGRISEVLGGEEIPQLLQYNAIAEELYNTGYLKQVAGIDTPEKFAEALTNGNLRAMVELIQQQFLAENGVHGNSYNFQVVGMNEASSVWDVNTPFAAFVAQISAVTGESYTASDLMDAAKLREINEIFRQNTGGRNIWELTGMSRENVIIAAPMDLDPSIAVAQGG